MAQQEIMFLQFYLSCSRLNLENSFLSPQMIKYNFKIFQLTASSLQFHS